MSGCLNVLMADNAGGATWQTAWTSATMNGESSAFAGYSLRNVVRSVDISLSGSTIRATFNGTVSLGACVLNNISIVEQFTNGDGTTTPTEFLTGGVSGLTAAQGSTTTTDPLVFTFDHTKSYLVIADANGVTGGLRYASGGTGAYYKAAAASYNVQNVAGFTAAPETYWLSKIEVLV